MNGPGQDPRTPGRCDAVCSERPVSLRRRLRLSARNDGENRSSLGSIGLMFMTYSGSGLRLRLWFDLQVRPNPAIRIVDVVRVCAIVGVAGAIGDYLE